MISQTKIKVRSARKENPQKSETVNTLRKTNPFWANVASILVRPRRQNITISLQKLDKKTKDGEVIVVPGKVLATGELTKKITIGAFSFSGSVKAKAKNAKMLSLEQMAETYKTGTGVRIIFE